MSALRLKPTQKIVQAYYAELEHLTQLSLFSEGNVSTAFFKLLCYCAQQFGLTMVEEYRYKLNNHSIRLDGALVDSFKLVHGVWEAKDSADKLDVEIKKKFQAGYPKQNILFQAPERAIIWQNGQQVLDADLTKPAALIEALSICKKITCEFVSAICFEVGHNSRLALVHFIQLGRNAQCAPGGV